MTVVVRDLYSNCDRVVFGFVMRPMRFVPLLCYDSRDLSVCKLCVIFCLWFLVVLQVQVVRFFGPLPLAVRSRFSVCRSLVFIASGLLLRVC